MRKWSSVLLFLLTFLVAAHGAIAQVQVTQAYVYGKDAQRTATYPMGFQNVGTVFVVQNPPANSTWKLSYYSPDGSLVTTASGAYNNPAPQPGTTLTLARVVPRGLVLSKGDWHIQIAINGQAAKDIYFSAGLDALAFDHAIVIGSDFRTEKTVFSPGVNQIGGTLWVYNLPAGSWMRLRYQRPDGTIAADNTWDPQYPDGFNYGSLGLHYFVNLDQIGTWHLICDLDGQTIVTRPFTVRDLAVNAARIGLPRFVTDSSGSNYLNVTLYLKGAGRGAINGHWLLDGVRQFGLVSTQLQLPTDKWTQATGLLLQLVGNHTIQFVADDSTFHTDVLQASLSGFHSDPNGWAFSNNLFGIDPLPPVKKNGQCLGMTSLARWYYVRNQPLPRWWSFKKAYTEIIKFQAEGNQEFLEDYKRYNNYTTTQQLISAEAQRVQDRLKHVDPCVIVLLPLDPDSPGHAVLASAGFYSPALYDADRNEEVTNVRLFSIYDPNVPNEDRYLYVYDTPDDTLMRFIPDQEFYRQFSILFEYSGQK